MSEADPSTDTDAFDPALPADELFALLADGHRRVVLRYLLDTGEEVSLEDLSAEFANGGGGHADRPPGQLSTVLHHAHLPKLAAAGLVRYDPASRTVEPLPAATGLAPLLDMIAGLDV